MPGVAFRRPVCSSQISRHPNLGRFGTDPIKDLVGQGRRGFRFHHVRRLPHISDIGPRARPGGTPLISVMGIAMPWWDRRLSIGSMPRMLVSALPGGLLTAQEVLNDRGLLGDPRA